MNDSFAISTGTRRLTAQRRLLLDELDPQVDAAEIELHLGRLRRAADPKTAAFATARLASLLIDKGRADEAVALLDDLAGRFAEAICLDGKTGRQLAERWRSDPKIGPLLSRTTPWPDRRIEASKKNATNVSGRTMPVEVIGTRGPFFEGWTFALDHSQLQLYARDGQGRLRWRASVLPSIDNEATNVQLVGNPYGHHLRIHGHLLVLSLGNRFLVFDTLSDPRKPDVLWEHDLVEPEVGTFGARGVAVRASNLPNGRRQIVATDNLGRVAGLVGDVSDDLLCYQVASKLIAADPLTGETLWSRQDMPRACEAIVADGFVLAYQPENDAVQVLQGRRRRTGGDTTISRRRRSGSGCMAVVY